MVTSVPMPFFLSLHSLPHPRDEVQEEKQSSFLVCSVLKCLPLSIHHMQNRHRICLQKKYRRSWVWGFFVLTVHWTSQDQIHLTNVLLKVHGWSKGGQDDGHQKVAAQNFLCSVLCKGFHHGKWEETTLSHSKAFIRFRGGAGTWGGNTPPTTEI